MVLLLSIAAILVVMTMTSDSLDMGYDWLEIFQGYENELAIIAFAIGLLAYVSMVSLRFYRPYSNHRGYRLNLKKSIVSNQTIYDINLNDIKASLPLLKTSTGQVQVDCLCSVRSNVYNIVEETA